MTKEDPSDLSYVQKLMEDTRIRDRVVCRNGHVSIQAGYFAHSVPRTNPGPFTHVEAGFPVGYVPVSWRKFKDSSADIYSYLPFPLVRQFIKLNGGFISGELPPEKF